MIRLGLPEVPRRPAGADISHSFRMWGTRGLKRIHGLSGSSAEGFWWNDREFRAKLNSRPS